MQTSIGFTALLFTVFLSSVGWSQTTISCREDNSNHLAIRILPQQALTSSGWAVELTETNPQQTVIGVQAGWIEGGLNGLDAEFQVRDQAGRLLVAIGSAGMSSGLDGYFWKESSAGIFVNCEINSPSN